MMHGQRVLGIGMTAVSLMTTVVLMVFEPIFRSMPTPPGASSSALYPLIDTMLMFAFGYVRAILFICLMLGVFLTITKPISSFGLPSLGLGVFVGVMNCLIDFARSMIEHVVDFSFALHGLNRPHSSTDEKSYLEHVHEAYARGELTDEAMEKAIIPAIRKDEQEQDKEREKAQEKIAELEAQAEYAESSIRAVDQEEAARARFEAKRLRMEAEAAEAEASREMVDTFGEGVRSAAAKYGPPKSASEMMEDVPGIDAKVLEEIEQEREAVEEARRIR